MPTLDEAGAKGFSDVVDRFMAPAATPKEIVAKLHDAITRPFPSQIKKQWEEQGANPMTMTQAEYAAFMQAQVDKWAGIIKANHIPPIN